MLAVNSLILLGWGDPRTLCILVKYSVTELHPGLPKFRVVFKQILVEQKCPSSELVTLALLSANFQEVWIGGKPRKAGEPLEETLDSFTDKYLFLEGVTIRLLT